MTKPTDYKALADTLAAMAGVVARHGEPADNGTSVFIDAASALRKAGEMEAALDGLAKRTNLSLQADESQVEGDPLEWVVYREHGGRSDREFTEIARAATPLGAARAALKGTST